ncbi:hypothetical protein D3H65_25745 [Paraflavitalea soli]|uniref:Uncharacterized protein n=1 Tax=Paraflavitalea soli TaxID=2315862 RepID=A0A3B7MVZ5_9BACT|nr:hypothetical protein [Paraflavitalea soli]AXY77176.1 hypothetical protein D3H65_25745 [Paraflavitalea soli]
MLIISNQNRLFYVTSRIYLPILVKKSLLTDILTSLASGIVGVAGEGKGMLSALSNGTTSPLLGALGSFRSANNPSQATKPKAYLNWILLDEQVCSSQQWSCARQ